jgi:4'-phosphopantetheinyl transferase
MNKVRLYFVRSVSATSWTELNNTQTDKWLAELSLKKQASIQRLVHSSDRLSSLIGLRLLKRCAQDEEIPDFRLSDIKYPESGKPYWQSESAHKFDFNISHSEDLIVVAMSRASKVGIDAEKIRTLNRLNFKMVMSAEELEQIRQRPELFFELWSKKEAVVKAADTAGISRMRDVNLNSERATLDDSCWHLTAVDKLMSLESAFSVHIATSLPVDELIVKQMTLNDLVDL